MGEVLHYALLYYRHVAPAPAGLAGEEQTSGASAYVFVVLALGASEPCRQSSCHWYTILSPQLLTFSKKQQSCVSRGRDGGIPGLPTFHHAVEHS